MPDTENSIQNRGIPEFTMTLSVAETVQAPVDATLKIAGKAADAKVTGEKIEEVNSAINTLSASDSAKVAKPVDDPNGTSGQVLRTKGDGTTEWASVGLPTDEQTADAVSAWLDSHPDATTTVQDGAITRVKLDADLQEKTDAVPYLKSAIGDITGNTPLIDWVGDRYFIDFQGNSIDLSSPYTRSAVDLRCMLVEAHNGDVFTISTTGGTRAAPYGFIASDGTILYAHPAGTLTDEVVTVDNVNTAYLAVNDNTLSGSVCIGKSVKKYMSEIDEIDGDVTQVENEVTKLKTVLTASPTELACADNIKPPKNRLDYSKIESGKLLDYTTGAINPGLASQNVTGYCLVTPDETINLAFLNTAKNKYVYLGNNVRYAFYDRMLNYLSGGITSGTSVSTPDNILVPSYAAYVVFGNVFSPGSMTLAEYVADRKPVLGNTVDYPSYTSFMDDYETYQNPAFIIDSDDVDNTNGKFIESDDAEITELFGSLGTNESQNRLNYSKMKIGFLLDASTGAVTATGNRTDTISDYCPCTPGETLNFAYLKSNLTGYAYLGNGVRYVFYTAGKSRISGGTTSGTTISTPDNLLVPENAAYVMFGQMFTVPEGQAFANFIVERRPVLGNTVDYPNLDSFSARYDTYFAPQNGILNSAVVGESDTVASNQWDGKTWAAYGDSITAISNGDGLNIGWAGIVNYKYSFGGFYGRGIDGSKIAWSTGGGRVAFINSTTGQIDSSDASHTKDNYTGTIPSGCVAVRSAFCSWDRITAMFPAGIRQSIEMVYIMGGTNDDYDETALAWVPNDTTDPEWAASSFYSTYGGDYNITTLRGAVASAIMKMQAWLPNALVIIGTPLNAQTKETGTIRPDIFPDEYEKSNAIIDTARKFGCPQIDVFGSCGINVLNGPNYLYDGTHPYKEEGKRMLARAVCGGLRGIFPKD